MFMHKIFTWGGLCKWLTPLVISLRGINYRFRYDLDCLGRNENIFSYKKTLYLSTNVFNVNVLIEDAIYPSPSGDGTAVLHGHPSCKGLAPCRAKAGPAFLRNF